MKKIMLSTLLLGILLGSSAAFAREILVPEPYACTFKHELRKGRCETCVVAGHTCPTGLTDCTNTMRLTCDNGFALSSTSATLTIQGTQATLSAASGSDSASIGITVDPAVTDFRYSSTLTTHDLFGENYTGTCIAVIK